MNMMMNMRKNMLCRKGEYDDDCEEECIRENANMRTNMHQRKKMHRRKIEYVGVCTSAGGCMAGLETHGVSETHAADYQN